MPAFVKWYYAGVSRHLLRLWDLGYRLSDNARGALWTHRALGLFCGRRLTALFERRQPRLIISTHPLMSHLVVRANRRLSRPAPILYQLTDTERTHATWFSDRSGRRLPRRHPGLLRAVPGVRGGARAGAPDRLPGALAVP